MSGCFTLCYFKVRIAARPVTSGSSGFVLTIIRGKNRTK